MHGNWPTSECLHGGLSRCPTNFRFLAGGPGRHILFLLCCGGPGKFINFLLYCGGSDRLLSTISSHKFHICSRSCCQRSCCQRSYCERSCLPLNIQPQKTLPLPSHLLHLLRVPCTRSLHIARGIHSTRDFHAALDLHTA